jgi:diguanylate cyclase (GGDEF)-like protein/PAS domain S-box-containing protein
VLRIHNRTEDPEIAGMVAVLREVRAGEDRQGPNLDGELPSIAEDLPTAYLALGRGGRIRFASDAAVELLATGRTDLVGLPVPELVVDEDRAVLRAAYATLLHTTGARTVVVTTRRRFGARQIEAELHTRGTDPEHKIVTVVLTDHTDEPQLVRLATRDPLTGLANRTKVLGTIAGLLLDPEPVLSVVYVDLDDLKAINDAHGHEAGDRALIAVAERLKHLVRPDDLVGRMSGDEFVVVCPGLGGGDLIHFVQRVGESTVAPVEVRASDGAVIPVTVSAGGASATTGDTTESLLRAADEAMFAAKRGRP